MPTYMGTLELSLNQKASLEEHGVAMLNNAVLVDGPPLPKNRKIVTNKAIVLENAAYGFKRPNILDIKLGVRLWADDAKQEKKDRFDRVTAETTHKDLGFRIAGMRVWQGHDVAPSADVDRYGYKVYDKGYGRFSVNKNNIKDALRNFIFTESAGIDEELGKLVANAFLADLILIQEALESQESRMFSASLLFVFEGDGEALRAAMEEVSASQGARANGVNGNANASDSSDDEDEEDRSPKIYMLKVIDFAHAQWVPGMGPDENALLGVRNVVKILRDLGSST